MKGIRSGGGLTRRNLLVGAAGAGLGWAGATLPARWLADPNRPPELYEYFVDCFWFDAAGLRESPPRPPLAGGLTTQASEVRQGASGDSPGASPESRTLASHRPRARASS